MWFRKLHREIGYQQSEATVLFIDNMSTIDVITSPDVNAFKMSKHVDVHHFFSHEKNQEGSDQSEACLIRRSIGRHLHEASHTREVQEIEVVAGNKRETVTMDRQVGVLKYDSHCLAFWASRSDNAKVGSSDKLTPGVIRVLPFDSACIKCKVTACHSSPPLTVQPFT